MKYISLSVCLEPSLFPEKSHSVTSDVRSSSTRTKPSDLNISEPKGVETPNLILITVSENSQVADQNISYISCFHEQNILL